jgi:hypothetical protein
MACLRYVFKKLLHIPETASSFACARGPFRRLEPASEEGLEIDYRDH